MYEAYSARSRAPCISNALGTALAAKTPPRQHICLETIMLRALTQLRLPTVFPFRSAAGQPRWRRFVASLFALSLLVLVAPTHAHAARPSAAYVPAPRTDQNSQLAHEKLLEKARQGRIDLYFVGDSITRRWGATDYPEFLAHWKKTFFGWNAGDFGWGADGIENILWRLENGELDGVNPKVIVILAGTNNVGQGPVNDAKIAEITRGMKALIDLCHRKAPSASIVLTAIFPRNDSMAVLPAINRINQNFAGLADGKSVRFLNVNDKLADKNGVLFEGMTMDKLHPSLKGYEVWAAGLRPILTELLGPPAKTDQAPPPTGDPSAQPK